MFSADSKVLFACYVGRPLLGHRLIKDIFFRILQLSGKIPAPDLDFFMTESERRACLAYLDHASSRHHGTIKSNDYEKCIKYLKLKNKVAQPYLR